MHAPLFSTITLFTELLISAAVYYSLYSGYKHHKFPTVLAAIALLYETIFNITYMARRVPGHVKSAHVEAPWLVGLAIVHGILSLIMFIALVAFFITAAIQYKKGNNYFKNHPVLTGIFIFFWTFSIVSGVLFYLVDYVL